MKKNNKKKYSFENIVLVIEILVFVGFLLYGVFK